MAGDNEVLYDDQLMIKYTVTDDGDTPTPNNTEVSWSSIFVTPVAF